MANKQKSVKKSEPAKRAKKVPELNKPTTESVVQNIKDSIKPVKKEEKVLYLTGKLKHLNPWNSGKGAFLKIETVDGKMEDVAQWKPWGSSAEDSSWLDVYEPEQLLSIRYKMADWSGNQVKVATRVSQLSQIQLESEP